MKHALAIVLLLAALSAPAWAKEAVILTEADNGKPRTIAAGSLIEVRLPGSQEAGPRWINRSPLGQVRLATADIRGVVEDGEVSATKMTEVFYFEAVMTGETALSLDYITGWDEEPLDRYSVPLVVE
ncbi:MAG: hypothetical protein CMM50_09330 [Rhodospirillaceae bacterium]|nr:hypothetical protein [Rhodospirillaceae bacterium]